MKYCIIGNFGNHSLAALQTLIESKTKEVVFLYVDTGWAAAKWQIRVQAITAYAESKDISVEKISPALDFSALVRQREGFPSQKFQWCTSFLKGLPLIEYLEKQDPFGEALIVSGKRQEADLPGVKLKEYIENSQHFQGRTVWHPLWQSSAEVFRALIQRSGFEILKTPSLACSPCIHSSAQALDRLDQLDFERLARLEQDLSQSMFAEPVVDLVKRTKTLKEEKIREKEILALNAFDFGCGSPWGCGE